MPRRCLLVLGALVIARIAAADAFDAERIPIQIALGETREIEVGYARMHVCDDTAIVGAEMRDKTAQTNVFVITGRAVGTTDCRAGLERDRPTFLFSITVVEPEAATPPRTKKR